ncbi:hypothetical protein GGF42_005258 [Coemansia sp. RSA 2424]|nr:hypothetical protein GGF42_005258 [Coemansia sp. RSA 2424]
MGSPTKGYRPGGGSEAKKRSGGLNGSDSPLPVLPLTSLSDSDTDLDLPDPISFLQRSPTMDTEMPRSRSRSPSNVPETPESTAGEQVKEPVAAATAIAVEEVADIQSKAGRKRKQQSVGKASEVDSNLTLLGEGAGVLDKAEPRAKRGRAAATPKSSLEKQSRSARSKAGPADAIAAAGDSPPHLCLLTTGLSEAQTARLRRAAKQAHSLGIAASISISSSSGELLHNAAQLAAKDSPPPQLPTFTHLVTSANKGGRTARTFKYLVGLVSGAWVVKMEWLLESVKAKRLVAESDYAITGDTAMPHCSLSGPRPLGQLLDGYSVHLWRDGEREDASSAHTCDELLDLIRAAGAKIVDKCPKYSVVSSDDEVVDSDEASSAVGLGIRTSGDKAISALPEKYRRLFEIPVHTGKTIILVDSSDKLAAPRSSSSVLDAIIEKTGGTCACRSKSWLFDCISANLVL